MSAALDPCAAWELCYVGLGANLPSLLGPPHEAFRVARQLMPGVVEAESAHYATAPVGPPQPAYLNAALRLRTALEPLALLDALLAIERQLGRDREREERWGPRTLDLDVLVWPGRVLDHPRLQVPHPHLSVRAFALAPLLDVLAPAHDALRPALEAQLLRAGGRPPVASSPGESTPLALDPPPSSAVVECENAGYPGEPANSVAIAKS